jgi:hypothetical protein
MLSLGFVTGLATVVLATNMSVFMEAFRDEKDLAWRRRQALFGVYCKSYQSAVFTLFNSSTFFWVASQFVATHVKYYESGLLVSSCWSGFAFILLVYLWRCARRYKHDYDGRGHGVSREMSNARNSKNMERSVSQANPLVAASDDDDLSEKLADREMRIAKLEDTVHLKDEKIQELEVLLEAALKREDRSALQMQPANEDWSASQIELSAHELQA